MKNANEAKQSILKAALDEISEVGIGSARTHSIAKRAGVTSGLLHYYFGTKEHLLKAIVSMLFNPDLINEITVIPYHRECSPVEKIQVILYAMIECNFKQKTYNTIKFYHRLMAEDKQFLKDLAGQYDFFVERYIKYLLNDGVNKKFFDIKYPSFFSIDLMLSVTQQMSMYYALEGSPEAKEFFPEPFYEKYREYFLNTSLRKIIIPDKFSKVKELDDDLKQILDTYIEVISKKEIISAWHLIVRLISKLFNDEGQLTGDI